MLACRGHDCLHASDATPQPRPALQLRLADARQRFKGRPPSKHGLHGACSMPRAHAGLITLIQLMVRAEGAIVHTLPFASSPTGRSEEPTRSSCRLSTGQYTGRLALKSMHPPCRQYLPHQACSSSGSIRFIHSNEIWGEASSLWVSSMTRQGDRSSSWQVGTSGLQRQQHHLKTGCTPLVDKRSVKRTSSPRNQG